MSPILFILLASAMQSSAQASVSLLDYHVQQGLEYGRHDDVALTGDLYLPKTPGDHPVLVAVHGGHWQVGDASLYEHWGPYLARRGYALFAIDYRLVQNERNRYPSAVTDVRAAVQFLRSHAQEIHIDPARIGLMGDSAGAQLASLAALTADKPPFATAYPKDFYAEVSAAVKVCIGIYGVYDLAVQWDYAQKRMRAGKDDENTVQTYLGLSPADDRKIFFDASPLSYVTRDNNKIAFLLVWGMRDDTVDSKLQSAPFAAALKLADFQVQSVVFPNAGHFWASDPITGRSFSGALAPKLLNFLNGQL